MERKSLQKVFDGLRESINAHRSEMRSAAVWTLNSDDCDEHILASRAAIQLMLELLELSRELHLLKRDLHTVILGRQPVPISKGVRKNTPNDRGQVRAAFDVGDSKRRRVLVRVVEETPMRIVQPQFGTFQTWSEARQFATQANQSLGMEPREAQAIIISSKLFCAETVSGPKAD